MGKPRHYQFDEVRQIFHEIKGPLAGIKAQIDLAGATSSEPAIRQSLQKAMDAIDRLSERIDAYLDAASLNVHASALMSIDVSEVIRTEIAMLEQWAARRGIKFKYTQPRKPVITLATAQALQLIISNLLTNAIKYNRDNGVVTVSLRAKKRTFRLSIRDEGDGIAERDQPYIFLPLYRGRSTKNSTDGFGLGLSLVQRLVEELHGRVWFDTVQGEGTTFFVDLPLVAAQQDLYEPREMVDGVHDFIQEGVDLHGLNKDRDQAPE